jgi:hypothetical protein
MKTRTDEYQTIRIWVKTHRRLRVIAALTNESIVSVLDRLSLKELAKLQGDEKEQRKQE